MKYSPITFTDNLNRTVTLRSAGTEDAEALLKYMKVTAAETPYLIREPDEITLTLESELQFIENKINNPRELMLIATIDGEHVGSCSLMSIGNFRRYAHRCDIAIALYQKYCGCGIGKKMLETILDVAKTIGYEQAELEVIADNHNAISLYEKIGFVKSGFLPNNMKYSDGTYADAHWMVKKLQ